MTRERAIVCIDVGNSFVKFHLATGNGLSRIAEYTTPVMISKPGRIVSQVWRNAGGAQDAAISSVVPSVIRSVGRAVRAASGRSPLVVKASLDFPFRVGVRNTRELGVDRLCAATGALRPRARSVIVVDVGSAITVDLVDERVYRGGYIMAGPGLSLAALGEYAARLPKLTFGPRQSITVPFRSTTESMIAGATVGSAGAIQAAVGHLRDRAGRRVAVVLTGGGSGPLRKCLPRSWSYAPNLMALGLSRLYRLNRPNA